MSPADARGRVLKRIVIVLCVAGAGLLSNQAPSAAAAALSDQTRSAAFAPFRDGLERAPAEAVERYALPITPPLDQGESDLCYGYATLSMLETNYLVRHPGSRIELSRAALQVDSIADRFARRIRGEPRKLEEGGLPVEAVDLIRHKGLVARGDFHDIVDPQPIFSSIDRELSRVADPEEKRQVLDEELQAILGEPPSVTHLDGETLSPVDLAKAVLGGGAWVEFDRSRDGAEGWGPSRDPDARSDSRVVYATLDRLIGLIHRSLASGKAVVAGSADHSFLIYGADYDKDGKPLSYLIKDSLAPFLYRAAAEELQAELNDVTVALTTTGGKENAGTPQN